MIQDYKSYVQSLGLILEYYTKTEIFSIIWWLRFILRWQHWSDALSIMEVDIASSCTCICDIKHCKVVCPEQCLTITCAFNFHIIKNPFQAEYIDYKRRKLTLRLTNGDGNVYLCPLCACSLDLQVNSSMRCSLSLFSKSTDFAEVLTIVFADFMLTKYSII